MSEKNKIIAIANQKGGVGKTTTSVNLSVGLARLKKSVLLVDLDPQGNATMGCGINSRELEPNACDVLLGEVDINDVIISAKNADSNNPRQIPAEIRFAPYTPSPNNHFKAVKFSNNSGVNPNFGNICSDIKK